MATRGESPELSGSGMEDNDPISPGAWRPAHFMLSKMGALPPVEEDAPTAVAGVRGGAAAAAGRRQGVGGCMRPAPGGGRLTGRTCRMPSVRCTPRCSDIGSRMRCWPGMHWALAPADQRHETSAPRRRRRPPA